MNRAAIRSRVKQIAARRPQPPSEHTEAEAIRRRARALALAYGEPGDDDGEEDIETMSNADVIRRDAERQPQRRALLESIYASDDVDEAPAPVRPAIRGSKLG